MRLFLVLLVLAFAAPALAEDADAAQRLAVAHRLVEMTTADSVVRPMIDAMWPTLEKQLIAPGVPGTDPAVMASLKATFADELKVTMGSVVDDFAAIYAERFTLEELQAIVDFYGSPAGAKLIATQPRIMSEMLPRLTDKLQASLPEAIGKVFDEARKQGLKVGKP